MSENSNLLRKALLGDFALHAHAPLELPTGRTLKARLSAALRLSSQTEFVEVAGANSPEGRLESVCTPEDYYKGKLLGSASIVNVLLLIDGQAPPRSRARLCQHVLEIYWAEFDGWLLHPQIAAAIVENADLSDSGSAALLEDVLTRLHRTVGWGQAEQAHRSLTKKWTDAGYPENLTQAGRLLVDYLYLQQAFTEDVRSATQLVGQHEPLCSMLRRLRDSDMLLSKRVARELIIRADAE